MSELIDLAFRFCSRAKEEGLKKYEILWLAEQQLERVERVEFLYNREEEGRIMDWEKEIEVEGCKRKISLSIGEIQSVLMAELTKDELDGFAGELIQWLTLQPNPRLRE